MSNFTNPYQQLPPSPYSPTPATTYGQSNSEFYQQYSGAVNSDFGTNGRVFFDIKKSVPGFDLFQGSSSQSPDIRSSLLYSQEETPLSKAYFSAQNMDAVQTGIRRSVYEITQRDTDPILTPHKPIVIGKQNETELQIIMRSIYLQYSKNVNYDIPGQISELNSLVIREAVPDIITNMKQYLGYAADIQRLPMPFDLPKNPSSKGEKTYSLLIV
jgi:hypothetical protein